MSDLLFFLLIIGWLAFSFYQQGVKKKRQQEAMEAARKRQLAEEQEAASAPDVVYEPSTQEQQPDRRRDFVEELERMLTGEAQSLEEIPEQEAQSLETIPEPAQMIEFADDDEINIYQKYYDTRIAPVTAKQETSEKLEDKRRELQEDMEKEVQLAEVAKEPVFDTSNFDLRKAVIYSEILNRRYR
ncbi:MAG TPA: hypothetical protein VFC92_04910 [Bacteroidales bacterium]|nr:hypothetical protein [Bacteroidales bacterium]